MIQMVSVDSVIEYLQIGIVTIRLPTADEFVDRPFVAGKQGGENAIYGICMED